MNSEDLRFSTVAAASVATISFDGTYASPKPPPMNESRKNTTASFAYLCTGNARSPSAATESMASALLFLFDYRLLRTCLRKGFNTAYSEGLDWKCEVLGNQVKGGFTVRGV